MEVIIATQVVFNNDGTKMFIVNHGNQKEIDYWSLTTAFDISTATHDGALMFQQLHVIFYFWSRSKSKFNCI